MAKSIPLIREIVAARILVFPESDDDGRMEKTYVIAWKSNVGAITRQGTKRFTREEAEQLAAELNEEHPEIFHEAVNLTPTAPAPAPVGPAAAPTADETVIIRGVDFAGETASQAVSEQAAVCV